MDPLRPAREPLPSRELMAFVAAVDAGTIGAAADSSVADAVGGKQATAEP